MLVKKPIFIKQCKTTGKGKVIMIHEKTKQIIKDIVDNLPSEQAGLVNRLAEKYQVTKQYISLLYHKYVSNNRAHIKSKKYKVCPACDVTKEVSEFNYRQHRCQKCQKEKRYKCYVCGTPIFKEQNQAKICNKCAYKKIAPYLKLRNQNPEFRKKANEYMRKRNQAIKMKKAAEQTAMADK